MKRKLFRWTALLAGVIALAALAFYWTRPRPVAVLVAIVEFGRVESTVSNTRVGTVKACRRSELSPAAGGQVAKLPVKEGDRVVKGQLLLELWNEDLRSQVELSKSEECASQARAEEAALLVEFARREAERLLRLHPDGAASEEDVDRAQTDAEAKAAAHRALAAATKASRSREAVASAAVERTILEAPFDGIVARVNAEIGEYVTPSPAGIPTPPAIDLIEEGCLYVRAPVDEVDAPRVQLGMKARVKLDAFQDRVFDGEVTRIAAYVLDVEKQARTVDVDITLSAKSQYGALLPGYSAEAEILLNVREKTLRIPSEALLEGGQVLVLRDGELKLREVRVGISNWQFTEVVDGLEVGELVVTSVGREGVEEGSAAVVENADDFKDPSMP